MAIISSGWEREKVNKWYKKINKKSTRQKSVDSPLCGRGCDADNHNCGVGEDLLQGFIVLALLQIVSQFLWRKDKSRIWCSNHKPEHTNKTRQDNFALMCSFLMVWKLKAFYILVLKSYHLSFTASLITKTQPAFLWQSVVIIWSHRYFNFCVYNSKFVIHYWPTMVSHFITRFFLFCLKRQINISIHLTLTVRM